MRRLLLALLFLLPLALPLSCGDSSDTSTITGDFVVRFEQIGGGCWNLVATDNTLYFPINLDNVYQIDGLRVAASLQLPTAPFGTFCPGQPMVVIKIAPLP
jgi:hypothetical protein